MEPPVDVLQGAEGAGGGAAQQPQGEHDPVQQATQARQRHQPGMDTSQLSQALRHNHGLTQDCVNLTVLAMEFPQSYTEPSISVSLNWQGSV